MVADPFMVMNSDARHRKEFSTENTLGGDSVLPCDRSSERLPTPGRPYFLQAAGDNIVKRDK